jgi:hypothetical protein
VTVIAAATDGRTVWMAADSASTDDSGRIWTTDKLNVVEVGRSGRALISSCGDHRLGRLVQGLSAPFDPDPTSDAACDGWAQAMAEAWTDLACSATPPVTEEDGSVAGFALLGYAGRIWTVLTNVADRVRDGYAAIGSGGDLALGMLAATEAPLEDRVRRAVEFACRHHAGCAPPVDVADAPWPGEKE